MIQTPLAQSQSLTAVWAVGPKQPAQNTPSRKLWEQVRPRSSLRHQTHIHVGNSNKNPSSGVWRIPEEYILLMLPHGYTILLTLARVYNTCCLYADRLDLSVCTL